MYLLLRQHQVASTSKLTRISFSSLEHRKEKDNEDKDKEKMKVDVLPKKLSKKSSRDVDAPASSVLTKYLPDVTKSLFGGRSGAPVNWNYPNKKFVDDLKVEGKIGDVVKDMPDMTKKEMTVSYIVNINTMSL